MLVWGCTAVSAGCAHCSAAMVARQLVREGRGDQALVEDGGTWTGRVKLASPELRLGAWPAGSRIFVSPMGDLFGPEVPEEFILRALASMRRQADCTFLLLTKRVERAAAVIARAGRLPAHIWLGASVEHQPAAVERLDALVVADAVRVWVNCEPLLGSVLLFRWLERLDWVAAGPEFGEGARPCDPTWLRFLRDQCERAGVPLYLKGVLDGRRHTDRP
jgi:protein gp37